MDPERPIEKLLRDYAKERREQAGTPELHPATRRLLQSEVARQYPPPPEPRRPLLYRLLRGRPAWAIALSVTAGLMLVAMLLPTLNKARNRSMTLAEKPPQRAFGEARNRETPVATLRAPAPANLPGKRAVAPTAAPAQPLPELAVTPPPASASATAPAVTLPSTLALAEGEAGRKNLEAGLLTTNGVVATLNFQAGREVALANQTAKEGDLLLDHAAQRSILNKDIAAAADRSKVQEERVTNGYYAFKAAEPVDKLRMEVAQSQLQPSRPLPAAPVEPAPSAVTYAMTPSAPALGSAGVKYDAATRRPEAASEKKEPVLALNGAARGVPAAPAPARRRDTSDQPALESRSYAARAEAKSASNTARFSQVQSEALLKQKAEQSAAPLPVLARFQVVQSGPAISIVDADGSVYTGAVQLTQTISGQAPAATALGDVTVQNEKQNKSVLNGVVTVDGLAQMQAGYAFQVAGTNRSLKQNVVFTGQLIPVAATQTNPPLGLPFGGMAGGAGNATGNRLTTQDLPLSGSKIQGVITIGKQQLPIDALQLP